MVDTAFGWDVTAELMEDWMYEELTQKYAMDYVYAGVAERDQPLCPPEYS